MANKEVNISVKATDKASRSIKGAASSIRKLWKQSSTTWKEIKSSANSMKSSFNKIAVWAAAAFAVKKIVDWGGALLKTATELELLDKKASVVFGDFKKDVEEVAKTTATSLWLTQNEFIGAAAGIADILVPLGFAREEAAGMSTDLVQLSWALAEWSNWQYNATQAAEILQKAMVGEVEQLKQMGIVIDQSSPAFNARIKQIMQTTDMTKEQARALDIQTQIIEKSIDAQNAFKEWGDSLARTQAETAAKVRQLKDTLATALWPTIQEIVWEVAEMITWWTENDKIMNATIETLKYVGDVIKVTIWFIKLMVEGIINIIDWTGQAIEWIKEFAWTMELSLWNAVDYVVWVFDTMKERVWGVISWLNSKVQSALSAVSSIKSALSGIGGWWSDVDGARALWWPVKAWNSYLVGENWPEIFTPWSSGIINNNTQTNAGNVNINLGGVTINNSQDEQRLVSMIEDTIYRSQRNLSLWIA